MAKYCRHCGRQIQEQARFCRFCGTHLSCNMDRPLPTGQPPIVKKYFNVKRWGVVLAAAVVVAVGGGIAVHKFAPGAHESVETVKKYSSKYGKEVANEQIRETVEQSDKANDIGKDPYEMYLEARNKSIALGSWTEELAADINAENQQAEIYAFFEVSGYKDEDLSDLYITGEFDSTVAGQKISGYEDYADGVMNYHYTEPVTQTRSEDIDIKEGHLLMDVLERELFTQAKIEGNTIYFLIPGENMANGFEYEDIDVQIELDVKTGRINLAKGECVMHLYEDGQEWDAEVQFQYLYGYSTYEE